MGSGPRRHTHHRWRVLSEVSGFKERLVQDFGPASPLGVGRLELEDSGWGCGAGVAYEIPEYAMRASLVYNSAVDLNNLAGFIDLRGLGANKYDVYGSASHAGFAGTEGPIRYCSRVARIRLGQVEDWSQLQVLDFVPNEPGPLNFPLALTSFIATAGPLLWYRSQVH